MSMLAERKRKQKWILNPRGKDWAEDTNKFGQKMLEKMGWSSGKGLGAKEDGMTDHIKVNYKNDSKGMGYKESDDQWTGHETNFSALLEALGGKSISDDVKVSSLEEKSQNSKARLHYKKFTRGKDLSRYSEKDLANIFGRKKLKVSNEEKKMVEEKPNVSEKSEGFFSNCGSMSDYFKKKLPNFGKINGFIVGNNGVLKSSNDSESESELKPSFGLGFKHNYSSDLDNVAAKSNFISYVNENSNEDVELRNKSKKLKKCLDHVDNTPTKKKRIEDEVHNVTPMKKKSKLKKTDFDGNGMLNPAFDPMYTPTKMEKHYLETIEETFSESLNSTVTEVTETFEVNVQIHNERTPEKKSKKKNSEYNVQTIHSSSNEDGEDCKLKKKKKEKKNTNVEINAPSNKRKDIQVNREICLDNPSFNINDKNIPVLREQNGENEANVPENVNSSLCEGIDNCKSKKKKRKTDHEGIYAESGTPSKKRKRKLSNGEIDADNSLSNIDTNFPVSTENTGESPIKKKKKKKTKSKIENCGLENPVFNEDEQISNNDLVKGEYEIKRKDKSKKKKKKEKQETGLDNPALNLYDSIEENCDLMLNIVTIPSSSESKQSIEDNLSIKRVSEISRRKSVRFSDVTRERIIPNKEDIEQIDLEGSSEVVEVEGRLNDSAEIPIKKSKKHRKGLENKAFDYQANSIEENITSITNTLDLYEAEIENDMNEAKLKSVELNEVMIGEVGNPEGENETLEDGSVKLKFKYAQFKKQAPYMDALTGPKKSYKHLIKGDIVVGFRESNLHIIEGYASKTIK